MTARIQHSVVLLSSAFTILAGQVAAADETEVRDLTGFSAIESSGNVELSITQGSEYEVVVRGSEEALEDLSTEVSNGTLKIRQEARESGWFGFSGFESVDVSVTLPELTSLLLTGGTDVRSEGSIVGDQLAIDASGGSDISLDVDITHITVQTSGGSDTTLTGRAERLEVRSSGGSDFSAGRMEVNEARVRSSGGADVVVDVRDRLVVDASGGSDVVYHGDPEFVDIDSSGGADVDHR